MLFKGLLHLLEMLEQADVVGEFGRALGDAGQGGEDGGVQLAGIRLPRHGEAGGIPHLFSDFLIQQAAFLVVALEQLKKAGLGACGALGAQQPRPGQAVFHLVQVHQEFLSPQGGALAHGGGLGGLEVGESQGGQIGVFPGELAQQSDGVDQLFAHQPQGVVQDDKVGVIPHVAAGGAQVDDALGVRALLAVGVDVGHHVVAHFLFPGGGHVVVDIVRMRLQLSNLFVGDGQPQLLLGLGQRDPQPAPGAELIVGRKQILHLLAGIAGGKRGFVLAWHGEPSYYNNPIVSHCTGFSPGAQACPRQLLLPHG